MPHTICVMTHNCQKCKHLARQLHEHLNSGEHAASIPTHMDNAGQVRAFLAEECVTGSQYRTPARSLYLNYLRWHDHRPEPVLGKRTFGMIVDGLGFPPHRGTGGARYRLGVTLRSSLRPGPT